MLRAGVSAAVRTPMAGVGALSSTWQLALSLSWEPLARSRAMRPPSAVLTTAPAASTSPAETACQRPSRNTSTPPTTLTTSPNSPAKAAHGGTSRITSNSTCQTDRRWTRPLGEFGSHGAEGFPWQCTFIPPLSS